ncbi:HNH endonuclease [Cohnella cholangitidis]|uniref:HNH domain-containing protein n=1 Tax=Cohnella cholangitidis TaxID=2598458 RepID=A0A7G5BZD4_9BACL|nr:HNH endonuclease [Cohnella cholangitidis]QMV42318.1 hypothetical protein FPL14_14785 [Cohnella cholangitidis]
MIMLAKLDIPEILRINGDTWTQEYLQFHSSGNKIPDTLKSKYRLKEIKEKIVKETHGKCAYCESKVNHICPGDIEHILPKGERPELVFTWDNLTLACEECNRSGKKTYYNPLSPLVNPYKDDPRNHFMAAGPMVFQKAGDRKGFTSQKVLKLNRTSLIERRSERLKAIQSLIDTWANETDPKLKDLLTNELLTEADEDKEYSFMVREYLRASCGF